MPSLGLLDSGLSGPMSAVRTPLEVSKCCWSLPGERSQLCQELWACGQDLEGPKSTRPSRAWPSDSKPWQRELLPTLSQRSPQAAITFLQVQIHVRDSALLSCRKIRNFQERIKKKKTKRNKIHDQGTVSLFPSVFSTWALFTLSSRDIYIHSDKLTKTMKSAGTIAKPQRHSDHVS